MGVAESKFDRGRMTSVIFKTLDQCTCRKIGNIDGLYRETVGHIWVRMRSMLTLKTRAGLNSITHCLLMQAKADARCYT